MEKFKIKTNEKTYGEVVDLLLTVGIEVMVPTGKEWIIGELNGTVSSYSNWNGEPPKWFFNVNEVSFDQLRALVSLHKNPINMDKVLSGVRSDALGLLEEKEWLNIKTYEYKKAVDMGGHNKWMEIPEGAEIYTRYYGGNEFYKSKNGIVYRFDKCCWIETNWDSISEILKECERNNFNVFWKRHTQPEELPFVDDECYINKSNGGFKLPKDKPCDISKWSELRGELCKDKHSPTGAMLRQEYKLKNDMNVDDYINSLRCADAVNHPSHYASGEIECIDAIESSMTHEAFCGYLKGNVQKYMWRYENKGGLESLEKAQWYLNKLISRIS